MLRADERGTGQSPGLLDTMSAGTAECFFDVVEWAAVQPWSTGKVGLLGISYYAGSQWRVAARKPKGLAAIVPWEGLCVSVAFVCFLSVPRLFPAKTVHHMGYVDGLCTPSLLLCRTSPKFFSNKICCIVLVQRTFMLCLLTLCSYAN